MFPLIKADSRTVEQIHTAEEKQPHWQTTAHTHTHTQLYCDMCV